MAEARGKHGVRFVKIAAGIISFVGSDADQDAVDFDLSSSRRTGDFQPFAKRAGGLLRDLFQVFGEPVQECFVPQLAVLRLQDPMAFVREN